MVGDSQAATLGAGAWTPTVASTGSSVQPDVAGVEPRASSGVRSAAGRPFVIDGERPHNKCGGDGVWQRLWPTDVAAFEPDVVVVAAGAWDLYDVELDDGRVVAPGDPTWAVGYEQRRR